MWQEKLRLLHYDNASAHNAISIRQFQAERNIAVRKKKLPYSPDLTPYDFFLFPELQRIIKETCFESIEDIKRVVTTKLRDIPEESFQHGIETWQIRMRKCMILKGYNF